MTLRAGIILIVGIITTNCVLDEASANNIAPYRIDATPFGNPSLLENVGNCRSWQKSSKDVRLINGKPAKIEDYPFLVGIRHTPTHYGIGVGSIIGTVWILTAVSGFAIAAISDKTIKEGKITALSNSTKWNTKTTETRKVIAVYKHKRFDLNTFDYDIAVVKVDREFNGMYEKYVPFADPSYHYKRFKSARILGWAGGLNDSFVFKELNQVKVYITPQKSCQRVYHNDYLKVTSRQVCAHGWGQGSGFFDGPLYQHGRIIGITSSSTCAKYPVSLNVFTKISKFNRFILKTMSGTR